ncbi:MAG: glycosyltransferase family 4 protein [Bacteroidales bacterium]|nr:glycosyltransferase family 4 protein [Bacteroidales bacterium]
MRIVYYSIPPFADADFPLIRALRNSGHEVYYIVRLAPFMCHTTLFDIARMDNRNAVIPISAYPELTTWSEFIDIERSFVSNDVKGKTGLASFRLYLEEQKLISSIKPDVIHYVGIPFVFHLMMMWKYRHNSICVIHDPIPHSGETALRDKLKRFALSLIPTKFVLLNTRQREAFLRKYRIPDVRVFQSSLGSYVEYVSFKSGKVIPGDYFIFFGRLSPYKGISYAVDAFLNVHPSFPDVRMIVAGAGPVCFDVKKAEETGSFGFIHRYLSVEEIADYVSQALFVVCPYTDATQSGVIQTALGLGTPVVASDVGNFSDVITSGENGLLVPPCDSDALAGAFNELLSDSALLARMRANIATAGKVERGEWEKIAQQYEKIYLSK